MSSEDTGANPKAMHVEALLLDWEKSVLARTLSSLWANLVAEADSLRMAAELSIFANLAPQDEFRLILSTHPTCRSTDMPICLLRVSRSNLGVRLQKQVDLTSRLSCLNTAHKE